MSRAYDNDVGLRTNVQAPDGVDSACFRAMKAAEDFNLKSSLRPARRVAVVWLDGSSRVLGVR